MDGVRTFGRREHSLRAVQGVVAVDADGVGDHGGDQKQSADLIGRVGVSMRDSSAKAGSRRRATVESVRTRSPMEGNGFMGLVRVFNSWPMDHANR